MKGVVFTEMEGYDSFPSIAKGSGAIEKEDVYRYAKRTSKGTMRRIGYLGSTVKVKCNWNLLTAEQFNRVVAYLTKETFKVEVDWQGSKREADFYAGNVSATPFRLDQSGSPRYYMNVSVNVISSEAWK